MTRGRIGAQRTLQSIPPAWLGVTWLVVPAEEHGKHSHQTLAVPPFVTNYSTKMQWLLNDGPMDHNDKIVILDDDLIFSERVKDRLHTVQPQDAHALNPLWRYMEELLEETALVGIHPRQMGHTAPLPYKENGKIVCVQGINRRLIREQLGGYPEINQFPILSDVVLNATLLAHGIGNRLITKWCVDWGTCQAPGGCSIYRTPEMQAEACRWLESEFGPYIKAVEKEAKNGWLGGKRVDFRGQWKRLYEAAPRRANLLDNGAGAGTHP